MERRREILAAMTTTTTSKRESGEIMLDKESKAPTGNMPSKTISLKHVEQNGR